MKCLLHGFSSHYIHRALGKGEYAIPPPKKKKNFVHILHTSVQRNIQKDIMFLQLWAGLETLPNSGTMFLWKFHIWREICYHFKKYIRICRKLYHTGKEISLHSREMFHNVDVSQVTGEMQFHWTLVTWPVQCPYIL